jgi:hypothetical protein
MKQILAVWLLIGGATSLFPASTTIFESMRHYVVPPGGPPANKFLAREWEGQIHDRGDFYFGVLLAIMGALLVFGARAVLRRRMQGP